MLNWNYLQEILVIAIACSTVTLAFIQKTKKFCHCSRCIIFYSFFVNMILGFFFSYSFTNIDLKNSLWVGLFSFLGADTIYRNLEGKLSPYKSLVDKKTEETVNSMPIEEETKDIVGEIKYE